MAVACALADDEDERAHPNLYDRPKRLPICIDLSPAATFIGSVYSNPPNPERFAAAARTMLDEVVSESEPFYRAQVPGLGKSERVEYVLCNEIRHCPSCTAEVVSEAVITATSTEGSADVFPCPACGGLVGKAPPKGSGATRLERRLITEFDPPLKSPRLVVNRIPVGAQVRDATVKRLSEARRDIPLLGCDNGGGPTAPPVSAWFPTDPLIQGERYRLKDCLPNYGITHVHHFYLPRQLAVYSAMWEKASSCDDWALSQGLKFFVQSNGLGMTVLNRYQPTQFGKKSGGSQVNRQFSGTLYVPSMMAEVAPEYAYGNKLKRLKRAFGLLREVRSNRALFSTQSATSLENIPAETVDYIFVDPPFGKNLQYSELSQIWEAWLGVRTEREPEAVVDPSRKRGVREYASLMTMAFSEAFRVLKAGRWITVEFHNSSNAVWHAIQEALFAAGFVVADVRTLDKMQQTYKQSRQGLMKQDLVISAYRPSEAAEGVVGLGTVDSAHIWTFVREHLRRLPVAPVLNGVLEPVAERQARVLYDRMVAFYVQRGTRVPTSAPEFYAELVDRFPQRNGLFFAEEQVEEYDRACASVDTVEQMDLFVNDEATAIAWLRLELGRRPRVSQGLRPEFIKQLTTWVSHEVRVELDAVLRANFLLYDGTGPVPSQIHSYLSSNFKDLRNLDKDDPLLRSKAANRWYVPDPRKEGDLEQLRLRALLVEFAEYRDSIGRILKVVRTESVRAGFKQCYDEQDYQTIVDVAAKLPEKVIQEDEKLLTYYDVASMRLDG